MSIAAISLLVASYTGCDHVTTMAFLVVGTGCSAFAQAGHSTNYLDIAPVFSGIGCPRIIKHGLEKGSASVGSGLNYNTVFPKLNAQI